MESSEKSAKAKIDHFMLGFHDLHEGMNWFSRTAGVTPVIGGKHPGKGTQNALISLSDDIYLEIIGPDPDQEPNPFTAFLGSIGDQPSIIAWAAQTDDLQSLREKLANLHDDVGPIKTGSRKKEDGSIIQWHSMFVKKPVFPGSSFVPSNIPFFLQWDQPAFHPSKTSPEGCRLDLFAITDPDATRYRNIFTAVGLDVSIHPGVAEEMSLTIMTPKGRLSFPHRSLTA